MASHCMVDSMALDQVKHIKNNRCLLGSLSPLAQGNGNVSLVSGSLQSLFFTYKNTEATRRWNQTLKRLQYEYFFFIFFVKISMCKGVKTALQCNINLYELNIQRSKEGFTVSPLESKLISSNRGWKNNFFSVASRTSSKEKPFPDPLLLIFSSSTDIYSENGSIQGV